MYAIFAWAKITLLMNLTQMASWLSHNVEHAERLYSIASIAHNQAYALNVPGLMNSEPLANAINACPSTKTIQMSVCYFQDVWPPDGLMIKRKIVSPAFQAFTTFTTVKLQPVFVKEDTMKVQIRSSGMFAWLDVETESRFFSLKNATIPTPEMETDAVSFVKLNQATNASFIMSLANVSTW